MDTIQPKNNKTMTTWDHPESKVSGSSHGNVTYKEWCHIELKRINSKRSTLPARIITDKETGMIAISRQTDVQIEKENRT